MKDKLSLPGVTADPWGGLRQHTSARLALGRCGSSIPTQELLQFRLAHARARDAVHWPLAADALKSSLAALGSTSVILRSAANSRSEYLLRPDLGRILAQDAEQLARLNELDRSGVDLVLLLGDGLSAMAINAHAMAFAKVFLEGARAIGFKTAPVIIVHGARVAISDQIGAWLKARMALILLGERPGLGSPDSMGAYLVHAPAVGKTDADRNCISNIRPGGIAPRDGAGKALYLCQRALHLGLSGVALKDEGGSLLP